MPTFNVGIVHNFGPANDISLMLPSPKVEKVWRFVDGNPVAELRGVLVDEKIVELREMVLRSCQTAYTADRSGFMTADFSLLLYSAELIRRVYEVSDDDLTMLHSGRGWLEAMLRHAMGGEDAVEMLRTATFFRTNSPLENPFTPPARDEIMIIPAEPEPQMEVDLSCD